jgi:hypothetical protein
MKNLLLLLLASLPPGFYYSQVAQPSYIEGYASPYEFTTKSDDTLYYWVQYTGISPDHKHIHNYRLYAPDSTFEEKQFVTFDLNEVHPQGSNYTFDGIFSTTPSISIGGKETDVIGAYPIDYFECYFDDFKSTSHQILAILTDGGADYPGVLAYTINDGELTMLLRLEQGNTLLSCKLPEGIGSNSKEIIAVDLIHKKILFKTYNDWINVDLSSP